MSNASLSSVVGDILPPEIAALLAPQLGDHVRATAVEAAVALALGAAAAPAQRNTPALAALSQFLIVRNGSRAVRALGAPPQQGGRGGHQLTHQMLQAPPLLVYGSGGGNGSRGGATIYAGGGTAGAPPYALVRGFFLPILHHPRAFFPHSRCNGAHHQLIFG